MPTKAVCVILASFNGSRFLREQVASIRASDLKVTSLIACDDCSTDGTFELLQELSRGWPQMQIRQNPARLGPAKNFLSAVHALPEVPDYLAFADQDDLWHRDKLAAAVEALEAQGSDAPALYCSRQRLVSADGILIGLSPDFPQEPDFSNAIAQNIVTGCTAVLNAAAVDLVRTLPLPDVEWHDWWLYLLITGAGGRVIFDPRPHIDYRQHSGNEVGTPLSRLDDLSRRISRLRSQRSRAVRNVYFHELESVRHVLTRPNRDILDAVLRFRSAPLATRLRTVGSLPGARGSLGGTVAYRMLAVAGLL